MKNQQGFGLIQILLTVGIIGGLLVAGIQQQDLFKKNKVTSDFNTEVVKAAEYINTVLSDPYICTATVSDVPVGRISLTAGLAYPGGPRIGEIDPSSTGHIDRIRNAVINPSTAPGSLMFSESGLPHALEDTEIRPGVKIKSINVVNDGLRDFIRVAFVPRVTVAASKLGAQVINKDFYLTSKRDGSGLKIAECNINLQDSDLRAACENVNGEWNQTTKKCLMADLIDPRTDFIEVWKLSNGTISTDAPLDDSTIRGSVSCQCDGRKCDRAVNPCRCALAACTTVCPTCKGGVRDNWDRCQRKIAGVCVDMACQYRQQCGTPPPPTGFMIQPR